MPTQLRRRKHSAYTDLDVRPSATPNHARADTEPLPSPSSSIYTTNYPMDDMVDEFNEDFMEPIHDDRPKPSRRKSQSKADIPKNNATDRMDLPLAVALIPPLGSFLTGGDFLRDSLLLLLLFFYLHQVCMLSI